MTLLTPFGALLVGVAALMAAITALLVKWASEARTRTAAAVNLFLFVMMVSMLGAALLYVASPGPSRLVEALWLASGVMSASAFPLFLVFLRETQARIRGGSGHVPAPFRGRPLFALAVLTLVVLNEFLMGWTFQLAAGTLSPGMAGSWSQILVLGVNSPWFLFPMAGEMGLSTFLLRRTLPSPWVALLGAQAALMALSPPAFPGFLAGPVVVAGSALMIGVVIYVMETLYRHRQLPPVALAYTLGLLGVYAAMMAGTYLWWAEGSGLLFAASVLAEMVLFFDLVILPERWRDHEPVPWLARPRWTVGVMAAIFVAEVFMGALLDLVLEPAAYGAVLSIPPLVGTGPTLVLHAVLGGFWFLSAVTGSTWFLAMMGIEMGALVVFKLRESRYWETRIRLALMMGSYGAFAVFYPSLYYSWAFPGAPSGPAVPLLGWSMGIGSAPLAVSVFGAVLLTYVATGALTILFGRRAICSVFCTAPLMFQGTTIDAMKSFNRSSPLARKFLSSRLSTAYSVTMGVVMTSLLGASALSYLDQAGIARITVGGVDPTIFLYDLYFGVLWYVMFVTIPYMGNYNCVTMGWCYTGTIAQAFHKIGFFKLKVRDREVCKRCTTLDCAKSCPVGLLDMPGHFRREGEFRSSKCCGVGDCMEACPYGNLYIHDVRHWVRERLGLPPGPARGARLPMVRPRAPPRPDARAPSVPLLASPTPPATHGGASGLRRD